MGKTRRGKELVSTMVTMTQNLGIDCVAEGIETDEQLDELNRMMCPHGQGFLVSRPLEENAAEAVFAGGLIMDETVRST
jgi:EAL domain-containing protein (putative c-di-GMP-specific phosphodiesterase class I)